jgi:hypothetical protein
VFSVGSAPRLYNEDLRPAEWVQLQDIRPTVMTWAQKAEETPLLEAVGREQPLETLHARGDLMCFDL